jgi:hypothetical protein
MLSFFRLNLEIIYEYKNSIKGNERKNFQIDLKFDDDTENNFKKSKELIYKSIMVIAYILMSFFNIFLIYIKDF